MSAERTGKQEVGGVTCRVLCTWQLLDVIALAYSDNFYRTEL